MIIIGAITLAILPLAKWLLPKVKQPFYDWVSFQYLRELLPYRVQVFFCREHFCSRETTNMKVIKTKGDPNPACYFLKGSFGQKVKCYLT